MKAFKIPKIPNKSSRPKQSQMYRSKTQTQSFTSGTRKDSNKRSSNSKQFPSSKQASSSTKFWKPTLSTAYLATPRYSSGRKIGPLCGTVDRINKQQMGPLYCSRRFQDTVRYLFNYNTRPTTTKPCIVLLLSVRTLQVPWSGDLNLYSVLQWLWHILR